MDFTDYPTAARYAADINAGYSANLSGLKRVLPSCYWRKPEEQKEAFLHGHDMAQKHVEGRHG
jgi:hypothetical protein